MRRLAIRLPAVVFVIAIVVASVCGSVARAETPTTPVQAGVSAPVDLPKLFDAVVETIDQRFVDVETLKTLDWQARANAVRPAVLAAASTEEAVTLINKLIAELKTSHTGLYSPDDPRYYVTLDALNGAPGTRDLDLRTILGDRSVLFRHRHLHGGRRWTPFHRRRAGGIAGGQGRAEIR